MSALVEAVLARLKGVKPDGANKWKAFCPVHESPPDGHKPSLGVAEGRDGRALVACRAGCLVGDVVKALGLSMTDLFPESAPASHTRREVAAYPYRDAAGTLLFEVVRFEPKGFRQRRPDGNGGWIWNLEGVPRPLPLYRLPELLDADPNEWIFVCEGEKDVDNLREQLGVIATCNPGGAGKCKHVDDSPLAGCRVALTADKEEAGRKHAQQFAAELKDKAALVRVIELPGKSINDASDWLAAPENDSREPEELRVMLEAMAEAAPEWEPPDPEAPESWPDPEPLDGGEGPPTIDLDACFAPVPELRDYVAAVGTAYQVDPAMPAMLALSCLSLAASRAIEVKLAPDWKQPAPVWSCLIAEPGERKSAVFGELTRAILEHEKARAEELDAPLARYEAKRSLNLKRKQVAEGKAASKKDYGAEQEAMRLAEDLERMEPLRTPRLLAQDATPESCIELAHRNGGRLGIFDAESSALENALGRYQDRPNLDFFLKAHEGDAYTFTRRKGDDFTLERPALVMALCVQPHAAANLLENGAAVGRGLFARFLYCKPQSLKGRRNLEPPPVPEALRQWWGDTIRRILELPYPGEVYAPNAETVERRECESRGLSLSAEAAALFLDLRARIERELAAKDGQLDGTHGWAEKLAGAVGRIALSLELARDPHAVEVSAEIMAAAVAWTHFLIPAFRHVAAAADLDPLHRQAARVLGWIQRERLAAFSHRDMHRKLRCKGFKRSSDWVPVAQLLIERGCLSEAPPEKTDGRPSRRYIVNPKARS